MENITYSIIIPCYNANLHIGKSLDSILSQEIKCNYEIIIIDDGSDESLLSFLPQDKHVSFFRKENGGVSSARNLGISKAKGKYLLFLDSDDIYNNKLFKYLDSIIDNDYDFISWGFEILNLDGKSERRVDFDIQGENKKFFLLHKLLRKEHYQSICSICVKRELIIENKITFNESYSFAEDLDFQIRVLAIINNSYYFNEILFSYIKNSSSVTEGKVGIKNIKSLELLLKTKKFVIDKVGNNINNMFDYYLLVCFYHVVFSLIKQKNIQHKDSELLSEIEMSINKNINLSGYKYGYILRVLNIFKVKLLIHAFIK